MNTLDLVGILSNVIRLSKGDKVWRGWAVFPNEGHVSLAGPPFKTNGVFLMVEETLYNLISTLALELKRRTLGRRQKLWGLIAVASININQPFPSSPGYMAAVVCPRVHLPWPLIPSLLLMMSLPGSHANGTIPGRKSDRTSGSLLPPSPIWRVSQQMEHTPCSTCCTDFYYLVPFKQKHSSSAHHLSYGPTMHSLSSRGGNLNSFIGIPSNYRLRILAHPPSS